MSSALVISVRFHDRRYHGADDWPPAPARLFQALVAGAGLSGPLNDNVRDALEWLERQPAPLIGAPLARRGQRVMFYMPNNDLDAVGGDPHRVAEIRTATKFFSPWLFDAATTFLYAWPLDEADAGEGHPSAVCALAERLYQLGRGIDMAWAWGEVVDDAELEARLSSYPGRVYRPVTGGSGTTLACPQPGSLDSLVKRYKANVERFRVESKGSTARQIFQQPPKPRFRAVAYDSPPSRHVYELRASSTDASFAAWPLSRASKLVVCLRDGAVKRLKDAMPGRQAEIEGVLVGRKPNGTNDGPMAARVKIVPLPSIGHPHADHGIRRVLVEVPADCPLRADDVNWAFSGLEPVDTETGEILAIVTPAAQSDMFAGHYGIGGDARFRIWRTVTPIVVPEAARRRRIDPARKLAEAKDGPERRTEQERATAAVTQALRHADVPARAEVIRVQREPLEGKGERVEGFAPGTRFAKERLWHVEITFESTLSGPLIIGDGRFLGLGVMAPVAKVWGIYLFTIEAGLAENPDPMGVAQALRRAVMARVQEILGHSTALPAFFSGHERDGSPAQSQLHPHLAFVFDPRGARLLVVAPHVLDGREATSDEAVNLKVLEEALRGLHELRAGSAGCLTVRAASADSSTDPLFAASRTWESLTAYHVTRHTKKVGAGEALAIDLRAECRRAGLPIPRVISTECRGVPRVGLVGQARLTFEVAVEGPVLLGRCRHAGCGLFAAMH